MARGMAIAVATRLLGTLFIFAASNSAAQEVAEIPLNNAPPGTTALGGGLRMGQSPYFAVDNDEENLQTLRLLCLALRERCDQTIFKIRHLADDLQP